MRQVKRRSHALMAWVAAAALAAPALATAQELPSAGSTGRIAWVGCWELEVETALIGGDQLTGDRLVCIEPAIPQQGMKLTSYVDARPVLEQTLVADGLRRPSSDSGCHGWEEARLSADRHRVFVRSEMTCAGGNERHTTGVSMLLSADRWLDIHVVRVGTERELLVRRYRAADAKAPATAADTSAMRTAVRTARLVVAVPLSPDNIIEALEHVDPAVVEAMLLEADASFAMDSRLLLYLADANVPGNIIDLMVALSFPDYFAIDDGTSAEAAPVATTVWAPGPVYYGYASYYGYSSPWFSPFGYGYYYPHPPVVVIPGTRYGGKVVAGRGYTRVRAANLPSGGLAGLMRNIGSRGGTAVARGSGDGGSGGDSGSVSSSGAKSDSGKSTGRKAKPRGQG